MADMATIGKTAATVLFAGSAVVWGLVLWRWSRGRPVLEHRPQEPVAWPPIPVFATFVVAMVVPQWIVGPGGTKDSLTLAAVQWRALAMAAQGLSVVGLLALSAPVRRQDFGWHPANWRRDLLTGSACFLASWAPVFLVNDWVERAGLRSEADKHLFFQVLEADAGAAVLAWIALSVILLAPLAEELTYRVLLQGWCQSQISPGTA